MKARIFAIDSDAHRRAQELLPWFVSGTLGDAEAAAVARHLQECARCKADAAEISRIRSIDATVASSDVERGWSSLLRQLRGRQAASVGRIATGQMLAHRGLQIAVVLQATVILVLAIALLRESPRGEPYRALGAGASPATADAVVVFRPDASQAQMAEALRAGEARIVGGPTTSGAYLLHLGGGGAALAVLRRQPGVASAASLEAEPGR